MRERLYLRTYLFVARPIAQPAGRTAHEEVEVGGHRAPTVDLQVPSADILREVSEEEPDVMPVLELRPARDRAIHDVVPRARVVRLGSSCHIGRLPPRTDERGRCRLRRWCGSAVDGGLAPYPPRGPARPVGAEMRPRPAPSESERAVWVAGCCRRGWRWPYWKTIS